MKMMMMIFVVMVVEKSKIGVIVSDSGEDPPLGWDMLYSLPLT